MVGADDLAALVQEGKIEFDRCIATPDMMGLVGRLGKVLGPRGLMPNPKLGTVTMDVKGAVTAAKAGQVEFRAEKAGIVHAGIGKASFAEAALLENARAFVEAIQRAKPTGAKGTYLKKASVSLLDGPGREGGCRQPFGRRLTRYARPSGRAGRGRHRAAPETCRRPPAALRGLEPAKAEQGRDGVPQ